MFVSLPDQLLTTFFCALHLLGSRFNKRIVVAFRGSSTANDWLMNLSAQLTEMKTPATLRGRLTGKLNQHVKVHRGFYEYLFDNEEQRGNQVYDKIRDDIKPFVEEGYAIYVTGHSLGAALGSVLAFKLAGMDEAWVHKPVSCVSLASPFAGGSGFRKAFCQLKRDGALRHLRITNSRDSVPSMVPFAPSIFHAGRYFHVGINLNFNDRGDYKISYPRKTNSAARTLRSALIFKPLWSVLKYHDISLHDERLNLYRDELSNTTINGLYNDEGVVGRGFKR